MVVVGAMLVSVLDLGADGTGSSVVVCCGEEGSGYLYSDDMLCQAGKQDRCFTYIPTPSPSSVGHFVCVSDDFPPMSSTPTTSRAAYPSPFPSRMTPNTKTG